jgi:hypothetical protein
VRYHQIRWTGTPRAVRVDEVQMPLWGRSRGGGLFFRKAMRGVQALGAEERLTA